MLARRGSLITCALTRSRGARDLNPIHENTTVSPRSRLILRGTTFSRIERVTVTRQAIESSSADTTSAQQVADQQEETNAFPTALFLETHLTRWLTKSDIDSVSRRT